MCELIFEPHHVNLGLLNLPIKFSVVAPSYLFQKDTNSTQSHLHLHREKMTLKDAKLLHNAKATQPSPIHASLLRNSPFLIYFEFLTLS